MEIRELFLQHYGKFENHRILLKSGVNIIYGGNETGKTTIHSFISAMLYGLNRARGKAARSDEYQIRQPWDTPGAFLGSMKVESRGQIYRIDRCFDRSAQPLKVTCETTLWESPQPEQAMEVLLGGVGEAAFSSTLCIPQSGAETGEALARELRRYMVNSDSAPGGQTDVSKALQSLRKRKKQLEQQKKKEDELMESQIEKKQAKAEQLRNEISLLRGQADRYADNSGGRRGGPVAGQRSMAGTGRNAGRARGYDDTYPEYEEGRMGEASGREDGRMGKTSGYEDGRMQRASGYPERDDEAFYRKSRLAIRLLLFLTGILSLAAAWFLKDLRARIFLGACGILFLALIVPAGFLFRTGGDEEEDSWEDSGRQDPRGGPDRYARTASGSERGERELTARMTFGVLPGQPGYDGRAQERGDYYLAEEIRKREDAYRKLQDELEALYRSHVSPEDVDTEIAAVTLAVDRICELSSGIYAQAGRRLNERASEILSELTQGRYRRILLDETAEVRIHTPSRVLGLHQVSGGTMQQIYFALRMAAAELLCGENRLPILLDEPFALYDDERLEAALRWLKNCGRQVILFTCQKREREILEQIR